MPIVNTCTGTDDPRRELLRIEARIAAETAKRLATLRRLEGQRDQLIELLLDSQQRPPATCNRRHVPFN